MKKNILVIILLLFSSMLFAQFPPRPNPPQAVNDLVGIFNAQEAQQLEQKLRSFTRETSTAIVVAVVNDLHGMDPADYTISLAHKWGVGQKGKDNGILIMIQPTGGQGQRDAFIAVGYGLEGVVPDAIANRIVDNEMIPNFKNKNYYAGVNAAVDVLIGLTRGEYTAEQYAAVVEKQQSKGFWQMGLFMAIVFFIMFFNMGRGAYQYGRTNNIGFWAAMLLMMNSGSRSGSYNNFTGGTGGFGGFGGGSGGGLAGFGGGGFGGGGSGLRW
jgi:uncharacterized protein